MNNVFQRLCSVRSCSKASSVICDGQFSFLHRTSQVDPSLILLDTFSKSSTLNSLEKLAANCFLEFSLKLLSLYNRLSKQSFIWFLCGAGPVAPFPASPPKKLAPLAKKLMKLDSAVVSMGFSGALSSCSIRSPCRSLLSLKPTVDLCKTILSSSFILESRRKMDNLFFSSLEAFTSKIQGKTVKTILVDHDLAWFNSNDQLK